MGKQYVVAEFPYDLQTLGKLIKQGKVYLYKKGAIKFQKENGGTIVEMKWKDDL